MKKKLLLCCIVTLITTISLLAQHYQDSYNWGAVSTTSSQYLISRGASSMIITSTASVSSGAFAAYKFYDNDQLGTTGTNIFVDMSSGPKKVYVRAKASTGNPSFLVNLTDAQGYVTSGGNTVAVTLSTSYQTYEFDYTGDFDAGAGGSSCTSGPCAFDFTAMDGLQFMINPATGGYDGSVTIEYVSTGTDYVPLPNPNSYFDDFTQVTNRSGFGSSPFGISSDNLSNLIVTSYSYTPANAWMSYVLYDNENMGNTNSSVQVNVTSTFKVYVRAKASTGSPVLKMSLRDENGLFTNSGASDLATLSTTYKTYTFDFTNGVDGGGPASSCTSAPCPVDFTNIEYLRFYINPSTGGYDGNIYIDYVSMVNNITGILDKEEESIHINPNPTNGNISVDLSGVVNISSIAIQSALGEKVKQEKIVCSCPTDLDLNSLPSGIYFLIIINEDGHQFIKKIIKE